MVIVSKSTLKPDNIESLTLQNLALPILEVFVLVLLDVNLSSNQTPLSLEALTFIITTSSSILVELIDHVKTI